jgi:hypothetical protein
MRWQVHQLVGTVVDPVVPSTEPKEPTTVTPLEIIYHRRVRLLSLADELGNVSAACRQMGISRTRYYEWRAIVAAYGLEALMCTGQPVAFALAVILISGIFRVGCGLGHIREMVRNHNFAVNNTRILFIDFVVPAFLLWAYFVWA